MKWFRVGPNRTVLSNDKAWTIMRFESVREWYIRECQWREDRKPKPIRVSAMMVSIQKTDDFARLFRNSRCRRCLRLCLRWSWFKKEMRDKEASEIG